MKNQKFIFATMLLLAFGACSAPVSEKHDSTQGITPEENVAGSEGKIPTGWQAIDTGPFTISLPSGWKFNKLQGTDSYVGELVGDGLIVNLDAGGFAGSITDETDPDHVVAYETINGKKAKIVIPKKAGQGMTGVYIGFQNNIASDSPKETVISSSDVTNFNVVANNLTATQQEMILKAFRTIKVNENFKPF